MISTLLRATLATIFLLFGDDQLWVHASQLAMEVSPPESYIGGLFVPNLSQCPPLRPRSSPPSSVHDLRPDDIQVVMAIGDSITAGAFSRGDQPFILNDLAEWRGESYAIGMDPGAITLPNLIKHYNRFLTGGSIGHNDLPEVCFGPICPIGPFGWNEAVDQLNAALTGALVSNLMHEVKDYLIPQVKKKGIPDSAWKHIMMQIGSNDLCRLCFQSQFGIGPGSPDDFEANIRAVLEYLRKHLPNTIVNLTGVFKLSGLYQLTLDKPYCDNILPFIRDFNWECPCALLGGEIGKLTRKAMDELQVKYNDRLLKIVSDYQRARHQSFAVTYMSAEIPYEDYPVEAVSNVDCFHPSLDSHRFIAAGMWNRLTGNRTVRSQPFTPWTRNLRFRCLEEGDRIITDTLIR